MRPPTKLADLLVRLVENAQEAEGDELVSFMRAFKDVVDKNKIQMHHVNNFWRLFLRDFMCTMCGFEQLNPNNNNPSLDWGYMDPAFPKVRQLLREHDNSYYFDILNSLEVFTLPTCQLIEEYSRDLFTGVFHTGGPVHCIQQSYWSDKYQYNFDVIFGMYKTRVLMGIVHEGDVIMRQSTANLLGRQIHILGSLNADNTQIDALYWNAYLDGADINGNPLKIKRHRSDIQEAHAAVTALDLPALQYFILEKGLDVHAHGPETSNLTLLRRALNLGYEPIILFLLEQGAQLDFIPEGGIHKDWAAFADDKATLFRVYNREGPLFNSTPEFKEAINRMGIFEDDYGMI